MPALRRGRHDPLWDLDGAGAKRVRLRRRLVAGVAFSIAIVATGMTAAAWTQALTPLIRQLVFG